MLYFYIALGAFFFIGVTIAGSANANFLDAVRKREHTPCSIGLTSAEFARFVVKDKKLPIAVTRTPGKYTDYYSSKSKTIAVSEQLSGSTSLVAVAIVAHELGHAITDIQRNASFVAHQVLVRLCRFLNSIFYLVLVGAICCLLFVENNTYFLALIFTAAAMVGLSFILRLVTVRIESQASKIGKALLREYGATGKEIRQANKIYRAALITYVGAIFMPIVKILHFIVSLLYAITRIFVK